MDFKYAHALVVFSGGQDSTTCLGVAIQDAEEITCVTFAYGQRHAAEIESAKKVIKALEDEVDIKHLIIDLSPILSNMKSSGLVSHDLNIAGEHSINPDLPASFVPVRNALFLTSAYGLALERGCDVIYTGVCQTDYSGYPDCREDFVKALNQALNIGYAAEIPIETPLMHLTKVQTFALANDLDMLDIVLNETTTCYNGVQNSHDWGKGCGVCPACDLRRKGWLEYSSQLQG